MTISAPRMLVVSERRGSSMMSLTPTAAARCTMVSHSWASSSTRRSSNTDPCTKRKLGCVRAAWRFGSWAGRQTVEHNDPLIPGQQSFDQVGADESASTRHQVGLVHVGGILAPTVHENDLSRSEGLVEPVVLHDLPILTSIASYRGSLRGVPGGWRANRARVMKVRSRWRLGGGSGELSDAPERVE